MPSLPVISRLREWARNARHETLALYLCFRDKRTPWYARIFTLIVVGYAFSPIDLIPDFIPLIGQLDDIILVPIGVIIAKRLIPPQVYAENRARAEKLHDIRRPIMRVVGYVIIAFWIIIALVLIVGVVNLIRRLSGAA